MVSFQFMSIDTEAAENVESVPLDNIFKVPQMANSYVDGNNVIITDKNKNQKGSIFSTDANKLDLTKDFNAEMWINIDGIADGVTFVMHNDPIKMIYFFGSGSQYLAVYGYALSSNFDFVSGSSNLKNSFAIEFDTWHNGISGDNFDGDVDINSGKGHIAYTFPNRPSTYESERSGDFKITKVNHLGVQYPSFYLGDGQWRLLKIKWKTWDSNNNGQLTYQYGDLNPVTATIPRYIFDTDSVYWGFTGTTGTTDEKIEKAMVAFKSVPGLVNYTDNLTFSNANGDKIQSITQNSEITVDYSGEYTGGKQNMLQPTYTFSLSPYQKYQYGTFKLNGVSVTPTYTNNELSIPLSKDLTVGDGKVDIQFKVIDIGVSQDTDLTLTAHLKALNFLSDNDYTYKLNYDKEGPTGTGKLTFVDVGDEQVIANATDYRPFLSEYQDDYSSKDNIKVELKAGQDIATLVKTVGPSSVQLTLTDEKGNARDVTVPLFIQNQDVVKSSQYILYGKDFSVNSKDYPTTDLDIALLDFRTNRVEIMAV